MFFFCLFLFLFFFFAPALSTSTSLSLSARNAKQFLYRMKFITKRREVSSVAAQSTSTARARCSIRSLALRDAHFRSAAKVDVIARSLSLSLSHSLSLYRPDSTRYRYQHCRGDLRWINWGISIRTCRQFHGPLKRLSYIEFSACELHENVQIIDLLFEPRFCAFWTVLFAGTFCARLALSVADRPQLIVTVTVHKTKNEKTAAKRLSPMWTLRVKLQFVTHDGKIRLLISNSDWLMNQLK